MESSVAFTPTSRAQVTPALGIALLGAATADDATLDCALVRTALWALAEHGGAVHVLRLVNRLLEVSSPLYPGVDERMLRRRFRGVLDELAEVGDLIELPGGYWHPAATREVALNVPGEALLIGGLPTSVLRREMRENIVHSRALRRVRDGVIRAELDLGVEQLGSWLAKPLATLSDWGAEVVSTELAPFGDPTAGADMRFYAPGPSRIGASQRKRWQDGVGSLAGRFLAEVSGTFGVREYRIAELCLGRVERLGARLLHGEARRLMYALDEAAKNPVEVAVAKTSHDLSLTLWSELPRAELRLFGALGSLEASPDKYYPRVWRFQRHYETTVLEQLTALSIKIISSRQ